ncbi:MAG: TatD family hydrolase, partial [Treponema sp.]|nr:TatD family hydrolase [Treponema sp.]
ACAASAWNREEFSLHEEIAATAKLDGAPPVYPCFAVHPQLPASLNKERDNNSSPLSIAGFRDKLELLLALADEGRISAVGETGFDLYSNEYKETEAIQDELFTAHLDIARSYNLPLILHVRRAMHKIFFHTSTLKMLPAVIFHSWSGTPEEAFSLLHRGIRAFFSFGTTLLLNHKNAIRSCAALPAEYLLTETDAPWQPLRGRVFSCWADLPVILETAAAIRKKDGAGQGTGRFELEEIIDKNFFDIIRKSGLIPRCLPRSGESIA